MLLIAGACLIAACDEGGPTGATPWFVEEAAPRGIEYRHVTGFDGRYLLPEVAGSGAALADLDGDGDLDAYLVQSGDLGGGSGAADRVYFNRGDGFFEAGPSPPGADGYGMGVAAGDYDNDGDVDLYVTNVGANLLLENDGQGRFDNVAVAAGVADSGWGASAAFLDLDADGDLDIFLANYVQWRNYAEWQSDTELECYMAGIRSYCPPQNYKAPAPDKLLRNNGDGTFTDVSRHAGLHLAFGNGFGVVAADYDGDGRTDVFVANDMMVNQLWLNQGDLRFEESAMDWGCGVDESGEAKAGMGVAAADIDDDRDVDILVMNLAGQTDSLYRNAGAWFDDATAEAGLNITSRQYTRFGVALADFDNDGRLDLYHANGAIAHVSEGEADPFAEPNVLFRASDDGRFHVVAPGGGVAQSLVHTSRGLAVGDVDNDGGLDMLVVNRDAPPYLLMNRFAGRGNSVRFRVLTREGRDAHAATVSARVGDRRQYRAVQPAASYLSSNEPLVHFGLGSAESAASIEVRWPDGAVERFGDFAAGRVWELRQDMGEPVR